MRLLLSSDTISRPTTMQNLFFFCSLSPFYSQDLVFFIIFICKLIVFNDFTIASKGFAEFTRCVHIFEYYFPQYFLTTLPQNLKEVELSIVLFSTKLYPFWKVAKGILKYAQKHLVMTPKYALFN